MDMRRSPRLAAASTLGLLAAAALVGCGGDPSLIFGPRVGHLTPGHVATGPREGERTAELELASGATTVVVHSADLGTDLYRISTPRGAGQVPAVTRGGDRVVAQLVSSGVSGASIVDVALNSAVGWTVDLDGGATQTTVDMRAGGLDLLRFGAGSSRIDATLPRPVGTVTVQMTGGVSLFTVHAPGGVAARVTLLGGAGSSTVDGVTRAGIPGGTVLTPDGWDGAGSRLDIDNSAGVGTFILERY